MPSGRLGRAWELKRTQWVPLDKGDRVLAALPVHSHEENLYSQPSMGSPHTCSFSPCSAAPRPPVQFLALSSAAQSSMWWA